MASCSWLRAARTITKVADFVTTDSITYVVGKVITEHISKKKKLNAFTISFDVDIGTFLCVTFAEIPPVLLLAFTKQYFLNDCFVELSVREN